MYRTTQARSVRHSGRNGCRCARLGRTENYSRNQLRSTIRLGSLCASNRSYWPSWQGWGSHTSANSAPARVPARTGTSDTAAIGNHGYTEREPGKRDESRAIQVQDSSRIVRNSNRKYRVQCDGAGDHAMHGRSIGRCSKDCNSSRCAIVKQQTIPASGA